MNNDLTPYLEKAQRILAAVFARPWSSEVIDEFMVLGETRPAIRFQRKFYLFRTNPTTWAVTSDAGFYQESVRFEDALRYTIFLMCSLETDAALYYDSVNFPQPTA